MAHVAPVLHQYFVYLLHRNEHVHGVQEAGSKHAQDADDFQIVDCIGIQQEGFTT